MTIENFRRAQEIQKEIQQWEYNSDWLLEMVKDLVANPNQPVKLPSDVRDRIMWLVRHETDTFVIRRIEELQTEFDAL